MLFSRVLFQKGITRINDILNVEGQIMTLEEVSEKFDIKENFLEYQALIMAIPKSWKKLLFEDREQNYENSIKNLYHKWVTDKKVMTSMYRALVVSSQVLEKYMQKWNERLKLNLTLEEFKAHT